jgi:L-2-hydroxyglutarate oxidase
MDAVVGGGIVGLAVAAELVRHGRQVVVLEKEAEWATGQTGRNSGVIHSGLYYAPGSLKAKLCVAGARSMVEYCERHGIPHAVTGKLVVATTGAELAQLDGLLDRGLANGVPVRKLSTGEILEREPHVLCLGGLEVASTGVTDFAAVARALADEVAAGGGELRLGTEVTGRAGSVLTTTTGDLKADMVIGCAGLHADRLAILCGVDPPAHILPVRGDYAEVRRPELVNGLVYPLPDLPFLGVHFTKGLDGRLLAGPSAGGRRFGRRRAFLKALQKLVPEVAERDLIPLPPGFRAQAVRPDGSLVEDFLIVEGEGSIHVLNAPSPAATAALEIAKAVVSRARGMEGR